MDRKNGPQQKESKVSERGREIELTVAVGLFEIIVVGAIRRSRIGMGHRHSLQSL